MRNSFKDPELQRQFAEQGYVIVPLLTPEEAAYYRVRALASMSEKPEINDPQGSLYGTLFDSDHRDAGSTIAAEIAQDRLEALFDDYRVFGGSVMAKVPNSIALTTHQHHPVTNDIFEPTIHSWLTLEDVNDTNGALRVVAGSHKIMRHIQSFNTAPYYADFQRALDEVHAVTVPMQAGEVILFDQSLLHGSAANITEQPAIRILSSVLPRESAYCILKELGADVFEALAVEGKYIDPGLFCVADGNDEQLNSAGILDNRNMRISEIEFVQLVQSGAKIRPGYDPIDDIRIKSSRWPFLAATRDAIAAPLRRLVR